MDFQAAFAMASQPPFSRADQHPVLGNTPIPVADRVTFLFGNEDFLAGPSFDFPFGGASTTTANHALVLKSGPLAFSMFEEAMQQSSSLVVNPVQQGSTGLIDSDEDFGDFESVPAEGFSGNATSSMAFPELVGTGLSSQNHEPYDMFDYLHSSPNAHSGASQQSLVHDDLFGHLSSTIKNPSSSAESFPGAVASSACESAVTVKIAENNSDDDWGDFVEHSVSANHKTLQPFDWFDDFSQKHTATSNLTEVASPTNSGMVTPNGNDPNAMWNLQQSANSAATGHVDFSLDEFSHIGAPRNLASAESEGLSSELPSRQVAEGLKAESNSTSGLTAQQNVHAIRETISGQKSSHSRKTSVVENISAPLSLSLFGEEELETENPREESVNKATIPFQGHARSRASSSGSLPSGVGNFSELIASLYAESHVGQDTSNWSNGDHSIPAGNGNFIEKMFVNNAITDSFGDGSTIGSKDRHLDDPSIDLHQGIEGSDNCRLEEQLFDLDLGFGKLGNSQSSSSGLEGDILEFSEQPVTWKRESTPFGIGIGSSVGYEKSNEVQGNELDDDSFHSLDWNKLLLLLIGEGRIQEALACRAHASGLDRLSSLQKAYTAAVEASEQEKETAIAREMEGIKTKLATAHELHQWQKRSDCMALGDFLAAPPSIDLSLSDVDSTRGKRENEACSQVAFNFTIEDMLQVLGKSSFDSRAMVFEVKFQTDELLSLAKSDMRAAVKFHAKAVSTFWVLACASAQNQQLFVKAWAALSSVCAFELEHALDVWRQAQHAKVHLALLANLQGGKYFAAVGQIYAVSLIMAAAATLYRPWLAVAVEEGKVLQASLKRCKAAWVGTELKEAVCLALCGMGSILPSSVASWEDIERLAITVQSAAMQAANFGSAERHLQPTCGLSLLPLLAFSSIPSVEWTGHRYLLPLANLWANCVSHEAPKLPSVELGSIQTP